MSSYVILFDIDGVLSDWSPRLHFINDPNKKPDWDAFYQAMDNDEVLAAGATVYNLLTTQALVLGHQIRNKAIEADIPFVDIITCRPERVRAQTISWFVNKGLLMPRTFHFRANNDVRPHDEVKLEVYEKHYRGREEVLAVFEDNPEIAAAWRKRGVECFLNGEYRKGVNDIQV